MTCVRPSLGHQGLFRTQPDDALLEVFPAFLLSQVPIRLLMMAFHVQALVLVDLARLPHWTRVCVHVDGACLLLCLRWPVPSAFHVLRSLTSVVVPALLTSVSHLFLTGSVTAAKALLSFVSLGASEYQQRHEVTVAGAHTASGLLLLLLVMLSDGGQPPWDAQ